MSQLAPFTDAARAVDETNFGYSFISYYSFGSALALALDMELRTRSNGKLSLDDFMRAMWRVHGKPGGPQPGLVANPYTLQDARARLAEASGDAEFADDFFARYVEGREIPDYARLLAPAGIAVRKRGGPWIGAEMQRAGSAPDADPARVAGLVPFGTPAFAAGIDERDVILTIDGKPGSELAAVLKSHKPGDTVAIEFRRTSGQTVRTTITIGEDESLEAVAVEAAGGTLTAEQKAFRQSWLGGKSNKQ
jgi:predicted metalloprotease with PDZ domain